MQSPLPGPPTLRRFVGLPAWKKAFFQQKEKRGRPKIEYYHYYFYYHHHFTPDPPIQLIREAIES
jgi:hypothetical protein